MVQTQRSENLWRNAIASKRLLSYKSETYWRLAREVRYRTDNSFQIALTHQRQQVHAQIKGLRPRHLNRTGHKRECPSWAVCGSIASVIKSTNRKSEGHQNEAFRQPIPERQ